MKTNKLTVKQLELIKQIENMSKEDINQFADFLLKEIDLLDLK